MYVTFSSTDSLDSFGNGTASNFKVRYHTPIVGMEEVGLSEISYTNKSHNVPHVHYILRTVFPIFGGGSDIINNRIGVSGGFYKNIIELIRETNRQFSASYKDYFPDEKKSPRFRYDKKLGRCVLGPIPDNRDLLVILPDEINENGLVFDNDPLGFQSRLTYMKKEGGSKFIVAGRIPLLSTYNFSLYVYSNIIRDAKVGDVEAKLMRTVPILGSYKDRINIEFNKIYYHKLDKEPVDAIEIDIRDDSGSTIDLETVSITLSFK